MIGIGKITDWNKKKGFGFITTEDGVDDIFFHVSSLSEQHRKPRVNEPVRFELGKNNKGKISAIRVEFIHSHSGFKSRNLAWAKTQWFSLLYILFIIFSVTFFNTPLIVLVVYLIVSMVTFLVYLRDKKAAQHTGWRTKEVNLHILALAGGWPGALWAQKVLRHKTQKQPFKMILWLTIVSNISIFMVLYTPHGSSVLKDTLMNIVAII